MADRIITAGAAQTLQDEANQARELLTWIIMEGEGDHPEKLLARPVTAGTAAGTNDSVSLNPGDSHEQRLRHDTLVPRRYSAVSVCDFQFDPAGTIHVVNRPQTLTGLIQPDGHGGTLVGNIDLVGDKHVSPSQIVLTHN